MNVHSTDPVIKQTLHNLHAQMQTYNANLHPDVQIIESYGHLRVEAPAQNNPKEKLFQIPTICLPAVEKFELGLENSHISITAVDNDVPASQIKVCEAMLELYNLCQKVDEYKQTSPWFALENCQDLMRHLIEGRCNAPKVLHQHRLWEEGKLKELILEGFLGRRYFNLQSAYYQKNVRVLMPFVDFLNHHSRALGFQVASPQRTQTLHTYISQPEQDSRECLVNYARLDPLDSLLIYGFVDQSSMICRSIPLQISLPGDVTLHIESRVAMFKGKLPEQMQDLHVYMPQILRLDSGYIHLSHLLIPSPHAPRSLQRILAFCIQNACPNLSPAETQDMVLKAEQRIVSENLKYYSELLDLCHQAKSQNEASDSYLAMIEQMANRQWEWILIHSHQEK